jgi:SnoaL-like domain
MKIKLLISLLICLMSLAAFAQDVQQTAIKTDGNVVSSQEKLITDAFLYLNKFWADKGKSISRDMTEKYFAPETTLIINGRTVYTGYDQFESHFKQVGKIIRGKIRFPLLEVISSNNKVVVYFNEDIYDYNGNYYPANVMAIFTLHNGKIQRWEEVVDSKYFSQPESAKVVYSK